MWKRKGQTAVYGFMLGLIILIVALALAPAIVEQTNSARNATSNEGGVEKIGLDCGNSTISNFDKATCYAVDLSPFYFIGILLFIAGTIVTARIIFGGEE